MKVRCPSPLIVRLGHLPPTTVPKGQGMGTSCRRAPAERFCISEHQCLLTNRVSQILPSPPLLILASNLCSITWERVRGGHGKPIFARGEVWTNSARSTVSYSRPASSHVYPSSFTQPCAETIAPREQGTVYHGGVCYRRCCLSQRPVLLMNRVFQVESRAGTIRCIARGHGLWGELV